MILLQQKEIQRLIRKRGIRLRKDELRNYLAKNCERISGLKLQPADTTDKNGVSSQWYEVVSTIAQQHANELVAAQFLKDKMRR